MWRRLGALLLLAGWAIPSAWATPRVGAVEVRAGPTGTACFTMPQEQERRIGAPDFDAIMVSDAASPKLTLWAMAMPAARTFAVSFRMCIPYGGRLPVLPQTPSTPLASGKVYDVALSPRAPAAGAPRLYRGRFCLRGGAVRQLPLQAASCPA